MDFSNTALVTHRACLDGTGSAILFCASGGQKDKVFYSDPSCNKVDRVVKKVLREHNGPVIIVDVAISEHLAEELDASLYPVTLLDHHKSALPLERFEWCEVESKNTRSGTLMLYDYIYSQTMKDGGLSIINWEFLAKLEKWRRLAEVIDDRDRWQHKLEETKKVALLHDIFGPDLFLERFVKRPTTFYFSDEEEFVLDLWEKRKKIYIEKVKKHIKIVEREHKGHKIRVGFVMSNSHQSDVGYAITHDPELNVDVVVLIGSFSVGLRCHEDCSVDLSELAKLNDPHGGGHKNSAGFYISGLFGKEVLQKVVEEMRF